MFKTPFTFAWQLAKHTIDQQWMNFLYRQIIEAGIMWISGALLSEDIRYLMNCLL